MVAKLGSTVGTNNTPQLDILSCITNGKPCQQNKVVTK